MQTGLRRIADGLLTASAAVGALCLVMLLAALLFDVRPLIFRSGSMAPTIQAGSLAIAHPVEPDQLRVGDIVSVPFEGTRVTHRVAEIIEADGTTSLRLRGDANRTPDARTYPADQVDRIWFSVPVVGTVIAWLSRPPGVFVLALYVAVMLMLIFKRPQSDKHDPDRTDHDQRLSPVGGSEVDHEPQTPIRRSRGLAVRAASGAVLLGLPAVWSASPTMAAFTDSVPVSGSTITAGTVPAPSLSCGTLGVLSVNLTWTAVSGAADYTLYYGTNGSQSTTLTQTRYTITAAVAGGTAWVVANRRYNQNTWTSARSNTRSYTVAAVSLCA